MTVRFKRDNVILYLCITVGYIIHWTHNDLTAHPGTFTVSALNNIWQVVYVIGINLLYFEYVLPWATRVKAKRLFSIPMSIITQLLVSSAGLYVWRLFGIGVHFYSPFYFSQSVAGGLSDSFRFTIGSFVVFAVFKLFFDYIQLKYEEQKARTEKKQAELLFLRSQINPHFLFNTLNNIYSLSQYQPHLVSESILRLSKILRYLLYETGNESITIGKEIMILNNYLDLERLRYSDNVVLDFTNDIDDLDIQLPPLLLLPLVENAFKHGVSISKGTRFVKIYLTVKDRLLNFVVINSIHAIPGNYETKDNIGFSNLRRRLSLLYKEFKFLTDRKDSTFSVTLKINLSRHV